MPELPFFQPKRVADLPGTVLDRERRPQADFRGAAGAANSVANAIGDLGNTQQRGVARLQQSSARAGDALQPQGIPAMPLMDPRMYQGQAQGSQALAQGMQAVGRVFGEIYQRRLDAKNYADQAQAENVMNQAFAEFEQWKMKEALANPESWGAEWQKRADAVIQTLGSNKSYSPMLKERLAADAPLWQSRTMIRVETDATKAEFMRAAEASKARYQMAIENNDFNAARAEKENSIALGLETPEAAALDLQRGQNRIHDSVRNDLVAQDPRLVIDFLGMPEDSRPDELKGLTPTEETALREQSLSSIDRGKATIIAQVRDDISTGKLTTANEWYNPLIRHKYDPQGLLSDDEVLAFGGQIGKVGNDPAAYEKMHSVIAGYDVTQDPSGRNMAQLQTQIDMQFQGEFATQLKQKLKDAATKQRDAFDGEFDAALKEVDATMNAGGFGVWQVPASNVTWDDKLQSWTRTREAWEGVGEPVRVQVAQDDARKLTDKAFKDGQLVEDVSAKNRAAQQAAQIRRTLEEGRRNGLYKTPQDMRDAYRKLMEGTTLNEARSLLQAPAVEASGALPSMQQGGQIDPSLFDSIFQQTR